MLFPNLIYTNKVTKQRALVKYVLSRLGRADGHAYSADLDDLTIEHLVPQSKIDKDNWSDDTIGQVGNLILVTKDVNDKLRDRTFAEKKAVLKANKCNDLMPESFWKAPDLTIDLIQQRTLELGALAYNKVWKI